MASAAPKTNFIVGFSNSTLYPNRALHFNSEVWNSQITIMQMHDDLWWHIAVVWIDQRVSRSRWDRFSTDHFFFSNNFDLFSSAINNVIETVIKASIVWNLEKCTNWFMWKQNAYGKQYETCYLLIVCWSWYIQAMQNKMNCLRILLDVSECTRYFHWIYETCKQKLMRIKDMDFVVFNSHRLCNLRYIQSPFYKLFFFFIRFDLQ